MSLGLGMVALVGPGMQTDPASLPWLGVLFPSFFIKKERGWSVRLSTPSHRIHAHEIFKSKDRKGVGRRDRGTWRRVRLALQKAAVLH